MASTELCNGEFTVLYTNKSIVKSIDLPLQDRILTLSNLDLLSGRFPVTYFYTYPKPLSGNFSAVVTAFKGSVAQTLSHYSPFAGRIVLNPKNGEPEILCNNGGIEVIEAHANISLASLNFYDLNQSLQNNLVPFPHEIPLRVQVTSYTCGGFSIAWSFDHALADAYAFNMFIVSWSEIGRIGKTSRVPNHVRSKMFPARSPPTYGPLLDQTFVTCTLEEILNMPTKDILLKRLYYVEASDVVRLQELSSKCAHKRTKIESFSAYLWKLMATAGEANTHCKMGWLVDGRTRMHTKQNSLSNLVGNVLSMAVGEQSVRDLTEGSLSHVAEIVHQAISEVTNEDHFLDLIDWIECHRPGLMLAKILVGHGGPAIVVSSGRRFPAREVDFGFGPPLLGTCFSTIARLGAGYVNPQPSAKGDGSWVVFAIIWPKMVAALESDPDHVFRPITAAHLGLDS